MNIAADIASYCRLGAPLVVFGNCLGRNIDKKYLEVASRVMKVANLELLLLGGTFKASALVSLWLAFPMTALVAVLSAQYILNIYLQDVYAVGCSKQGKCLYLASYAVNALAAGMGVCVAIAASTVTFGAVLDGVVLLTMLYALCPKRAPAPPRLRLPT